jgi:hypothetical protein
MSPVFIYIILVPVSAFFHLFISVTWGWHFSFCSLPYLFSGSALTKADDVQIFHTLSASFSSPLLREQSDEEMNKKQRVCKLTDKGKVISRYRIAVLTICASRLFCSGDKSNENQELLGKPPL